MDIKNCNDELTDEQKIHEVIAMSKIGVPLSIIAKMMNVPMSAIEHLKNERANNSE
ncbi:MULTISPECIES: hypothetical protein [Cysteiniphilum]|uniref:hypothetical protein n=1 Tax=Cysteiniphilum TaxID=2056696 RepID=UPI001786B76A|nr:MULTISPECIES: hypothetical protein [Cysteiniphilum]